MELLIKEIINIINEIISICFQFGELWRIWLPYPFWFYFFLLLSDLKFVIQIS